jgi:ribosomal protein S18 acetylase RimI-like enzyme
MYFALLDLADPATASELLELQRAAYAVEARLIRSEEIPPLRETLAELQGCGETVLGASVDGTLAGFISWKVAGDTLDIHRLVVDPARFRAGIGSALVRKALAANEDARRAIVQTGATNEPAKALYLREGFTLVDEIEPVPGLRVARFARDLEV